MWYFCTPNRGVEQLVARRAHNPKVGGSSPSPATTRGQIFLAFFCFCAMYTVYVLYSSKFNKTYVGFTSNLKERFKSHNELGTKGYTVKFRPWTIAFTEEYETKPEAMKREKALKGGKGRAYIKAKLIELGLISA